MSVKVQHGNFVRLTQEEINGLKPQMIQYGKQLWELKQLKKEQRDQNVTLAKLAKEKAEAEKKLTNADTKIEQGRVKMAKAEAEDKFLNVEIFCIALNLPIPKETDIAKIDEITSTYFPKGEIGDSSDGSHKIALKSMKPFKEYLKTYPEGISKINLTSIQVVENPEKVIKFLQKFKQIKAIGFDGDLQNTLEPILDKICPVKERKFSIVFVPKDAEAKSKNAPLSQEPSTTISQGKKNIKEIREKQLEGLQERLKKFYIGKEPAFDVLLRYLSENPNKTPKEAFIYVTNLK